MPRNLPRACCDCGGGRCPVVPTGVWRDCQSRVTGAPAAGTAGARSPGQRPASPLLRFLASLSRQPPPLSCFLGTPTPHSLFPWYFQPVTNALISGAEGAPGAVNTRPCPDGRGCGVPMTMSPGWAQTCDSPHEQCFCPPRWRRRVPPGGTSRGKSSRKTVTEHLIRLKFPARLPGGGVCQPGRPLQSSAVRVSPPWRDSHPASRPSGGRRAALG